MDTFEGLILQAKNKHKSCNILYKNVGNILYYNHINYNHLKSQNETAV